MLRWEKECEEATLIASWEANWIDGEDLHGAGKAKMR